MKLSTKKIAIINFEGYWNPLIKLINHIVKEEFMGSNNLNYFKEINDIKMLKNFLKGL